jgi:SAM-dependent methyltransferase
VPRLYEDLAEWWPLFSPPEEYAEEAACARGLFEREGGAPRTLLELGSGGGHVPSHLKAHYALTLVDLSPDMLRVSRALDAECEHFEGDMRTLRLGRLFDAVFVHDAVMYMTREADLAAPAAHCRPGGVAIFQPDCVAERFAPRCEAGGSDGGGRGVRFLEWTHAPAAGATSFVTDYAILLRDATGATRVVHDRHEVGLFPRATWLRLLGEAGFAARAVPDPWRQDVFVCRRE